MAAPDLRLRRLTPDNILHFTVALTDTARPTCACDAWAAPALLSAGSTPLASASWRAASGSRLESSKSLRKRSRWRTSCWNSS
jgi:hypothetical protein